MSSLSSPSLNESPGGPSRTLEYASSGDGGKPTVLGLTISAWMTIGIVTLLMIWTFWHNLVRLWGKTNPFTGESEWGHGIVVPVIGLYYLYVNKEELLAATVKPLLAGTWTRGRWIGALVVATMGLLAIYVGPSVVPSQAQVLAVGGKGLLALSVLVIALDWGLATTLFGLWFFSYGIWPGQNDYFKDLGMVLTLFGVVLTLCGWQVMKIAWFPIAFLICALPWPGLFYSWVAGPLQVLAAKVAVGVMNFSGVDSFQSGTKIHIGARVLNVAEACAGLKSLMTFITVAAAVAFLSSRALWQKLFLVSMAVPIAIFCNVLRVSGQGLLDHYVGSQWSENFAHQFVGLVMLVPAFFMILGLGWVLDQLFVEDADEEAERAAAVASGAAKDLTVTASAPALAGAGAGVSAVPPPLAAIPVRAVKQRAAAAIEERSRTDASGAAPATPVQASTSDATEMSTAGSSTAGAPVRAPRGPAGGAVTAANAPRRGYVPPAFVPPGTGQPQANGAAVNGTGNGVATDNKEKP